jgi:diguanylate cyclase (GGDEF)-like protein
MNTRLFRAAAESQRATEPETGETVRRFAFGRTTAKYPVTRVLTWISGIISVVIVFAIPAGYFFTAYQYELNRIHYEADVAADAISQYVVTNPKRWRTDELRLRDLLSLRMYARESPDLHRAFDETGKLLAEVGARPEFPIIAQSSPIRDGYNVVGEIQISDTLRPILFRTGVAALLALIIASGVFLTLRLLPMRALMRTVTELEESKQNLSREISEKEAALKKAEEIGAAMTHLALHDTLTNLPNRELFNDRLKQSISAAEHEKKMLAVIIIDLNRFKEVNDRLGHLAGDLVLREVACRLQELLRKSDMVARMGGDEFAILLPALSSREDTTIVANKIVKTMQLPIMLSMNSVDVGASIGIALFPENGSDNESLLRCADIGMYIAKRNKGGFAYYDPEYDRERKERDALHHDFLRALNSDDELILHYQPLIDVKSGDCYGVEALVRWNHPQRGLLLPNIVIPLTEDASLTTALSLYVLKQALRQIQEWQGLGLGPDFKIAMNIFAADLQGTAFPDGVTAALANSEENAAYLEFEITETAFMEKPDRAAETIARLRDMGITISIDDFGTGYSSMSYLKKLPVSTIKIDQSFVIDMRHDSNDSTIVRSIIALGHNLGLKVVAEGVEDLPTLNELKSFGCDFAQGFYFSHPVPAEDLVKWLKGSPWSMQVNS